MKNVIKIIKDDFKHLFTSAISLCVVFGLIAVPTIYSLFNIAGYWDPYSGTSQLEIGIVDDDAGYKTKTIPVDIQLGKYAMNSLNENKDFKWIVTDYDTAINKVYSGDYYAALIIPEDFSNQLVNILTGKQDSAKIMYYSNQKYSPITPKLIDNGVNTIQQKINYSFSETIYEAVFKTCSEILNITDSNTVSKLSSSLINSFSDTMKELNNLNIQLDTLNDMLTTIDETLDLSNSLLTLGDSEAINTLYQKLNEVKNMVSNSRSYINNAKNILESLGLLPDLQNLLNDMSNTCSNIENMATISQKIIDDTKDLNNNLLETISSLKTTSNELKNQIDYMRNDFNSISSDLQLAIDKISGLSSSSSIEDVKKIIGDDPSTFAELIAAPVVMDRHELYPIENFGTAITGFFVSLSCWAGCLILCTMLITKLSRKRQKELEKDGKFRGWQLYFGRYAIYGTFALLQSSVMCLACIFFLQIKMAHPFMFLLTGWIIALCFSFFIYTLVAAFGSGGKVLAVILLVLQVAATGGTFPIVMMTEIYQHIYPYLPITYTVKAFNMCIGGFSDIGIYWQYILYTFGSLTIISLLIGLILRSPISKLSEWFETKLHKTNLFAI